MDAADRAMEAADDYDTFNAHEAESSTRAWRPSVVLVAAALFLGVVLCAYSVSGPAEVYHSATTVRTSQTSRVEYCIEEVSDIPGYHFDHQGYWKEWTWGNETESVVACADSCTANEDCVAFSRNQMNDLCYQYSSDDVHGDDDHDTQHAEDMAENSASDVAYTKVQAGCLNCTACGTGTEVVDECNRASDRTCRCTNGFVGLHTPANTTATECTACPEGKFTGPGSNVCHGCTVCGFRTELLEACGVEDTKCGCHAGHHDMIREVANEDDDFETMTCDPEVCVAGVTWSSSPNYPGNGCTPCSTCGTGTTQSAECTLTTDTVCRCNSGNGQLVPTERLFGAVWGTEMECGGCPVGVSFAGSPGQDGGCTPCTSCGAGTYPHSECTATEDRLCRCSAGSGAVMQSSYRAQAAPSHRIHDGLRPLAGLGHVALPSGVNFVTGLGGGSGGGSGDVKVMTCSGCASGSTYAERPGMSCQPCLSCGSGTVQYMACSPDMNRECVCDVGYGNMVVSSLGAPKEATCEKVGDGDGDGDGKLEIGELLMLGSDPDGDGDSDGDGHPY